METIQLNLLKMYGISTCDFYTVSTYAHSKRTDIFLCNISTDVTLKYKERLEVLIATINDA